MKKFTSILAIAAFAAFSAPVAQAATAQGEASVQLELKKLKEMAGNGQISMKKYNERKKELMAQIEGQQVGEAKKN